MYKSCQKSLVRGIPSSQILPKEAKLISLHFQNAATTPFVKQLVSFCTVLPFLVVHQETLKLRNFSRGRRGLSRLIFEKIRICISYRGAPPEIYHSRGVYYNDQEEEHEILSTSPQPTLSY